MGTNQRSGSTSASTYRSIQPVESCAESSADTLTEKYVPCAKEQQKSRRNVLGWPTIALCVPMLLISGTLLTIIFGYEVKPEANAFTMSDTAAQVASGNFIPVDFSATQIAFLADLTSTVGPFLAGSSMSLASVILIHRLKQPRDQMDPLALPTPHQLSLLIGTLAASYDQLWKSLRYLLLRRRKTTVPQVLWYTVSILLLSIVLGIALTVADAVFHTLTTTDSITLCSSASISLHDYGRELNRLCASLDRVHQNYGFPCTAQGNSSFSDPNYATEQAEIQYLAHNTSTTLEIRYASLEGSQNVQLAYLIPKPSIIGPQLDFQASTFGVASQCKLMPVASCNTTIWGQPSPVYTNLTCSSNFYGVLGLPPNATNIAVPRQPSPYISFLATKPQSNLQYNFFNDSSLQNVYNPAGLTDSGIPDPVKTPLADSQLLSTIHMAFAWRTSSYSFLNGLKNEMVPSNWTSHHSNTSWVDYFLSCEVQAYDVESLLSISASLASDGTLLNMWQGS